MYESPIEKIVQYIQENLIKQEEDHLMAQITETVGYQINKEELIKALKYDRNQYHIGFEDARKMYERAKGEWIPFSKELPPKGKKVHVSTFGIVTIGERTSEADEALRLSILEPMNNLYKNIDPKQYQITHWQPLPEPYKAEEEVSE